MAHRLIKFFIRLLTHSFNGPFSSTTQVSRYQKGKTNLDFTEARDNEWQWHQVGHMQVCTLLQTDSHTSTLFFYRPDALPAAQPTASKHGRQYLVIRSLTKQVIAFSPNYLIDTFKSWISMEVESSCGNYECAKLCIEIINNCRSYYGS